MNLIHGRFPHGRYPHAGNVNTSKSSGSEKPSSTQLKPNVFSVKCYNAEGIKTAEYNSTAADNIILSLKFEIISTGCGKFDIKFARMPDTEHFGYNRRIDIHLFNDSRPWYCGFVQSRPMAGKTPSGSDGKTDYTISGFGYYDLLGRVLVDGNYTNMDVADIIRSIGAKIESKTGIRVLSSEIVKTGYVVSRLVFDGETAKDALSQLVEFSANYVAGVDQYKRLYFRPIESKINEQARFWVGQHLDKYEPEEDLGAIVNFARIKGGKLDNEGTNWLGTVQDTESQNKYGIREAVWSLPSAYSEKDALRWGNEKLKSSKEPVTSAKLGNVKLEYPKADGAFDVRKLTTKGRTAIYTLEGDTHYYPIEKIAYDVSASKGIYCNLTVGKVVSNTAHWLAQMERNAKNQEFLQNNNTKQLRGGY